MQTLPAHLSARRPSGLTQSIAAGLSQGSPPTLSIKGNRFTLVDAAGNTKPLQTLHVDAVIIHANPHVSKLYYDKPYDPQATEFEPPACFSDNGIGPSASSAKPQSPTCAACPHNAWGSNVSRVTGKPTKACNDLKKIAVLIPETPDMAFLLRVPPASLKHLGAYVKMIGAQNGGNRPVEVSDVVTRITFDPQVQGVLNFAPVGWVDERTVGAMEKIWEAKSADDMVGLNDTVHLGAPQIAPPHAGQTTQQLPPPPAPPAQAQQPAAMFTPSPTPVTPAQAPQAVPASQEQPASPRRGRPRKAEAAPPAVVPAQAPFMQPAAGLAPAPTFGGPAAQHDDGGDIPAFLRRQPDQPAAPAPQPAFGMVPNPPAPNAELKQALDKAMNFQVPK